MIYSNRMRSVAAVVGDVTVPGMAKYKSGVTVVSNASRLVVVVVVVESGGSVVVMIIRVISRTMVCRPCTVAVTMVSQR